MMISVRKKANNCKFKEKGLGTYPKLFMLTIQEIHPLTSVFIKKCRKEKH